jgi:hypothetical protein
MSIWLSDQLRILVWWKCTFLRRASHMSIVDLAAGRQMAKSLSLMARVHNEILIGFSLMSSIN